MGFGKTIGKYQLGRTIGEGAFSKVKIGVNANNGQKVAIKVIDKHMILENKLNDQANLIRVLIFFFTLASSILLFTFLNQ